VNARRAPVLTVALATLLCAATSARAPGGPLTPVQQSAFLSSHNAWRERAGVPGLRWSDSLAASAEEWAKSLAGRGCRLRHDADADVGQNLFYASAERSGSRRSAVVVTPAEVVADWASEVRSYSAERHACRPGRTCGHYTQIVWRSTTDLGCGMALCPDLGQIWVCNYRPAGNIQGRRPY
jgi:pathogenesis-related protein 1